MNRIARLLAIIAFVLSPTAYAAFTVVAPGVNAGVGVAADPSGNTVYFTEWNTGFLKRIDLASSPGCAPCPVVPVLGGFSHPQDVALDAVHNVAYVTTRDDPGTTGALWRVDLSTSARTLITFNLGAPHQIALDVATNSAYIVGFTSGRLWKVNLATGSKSTVISGLTSPVGVTLRADRTRAYVTEQAASGRLAEIDVATHTRIRNVVTGLTQPFYVSWTNPAELALYVVERNPANDVRRVDLGSSTTVTPFTGLPSNPSGISVNAIGGAAYVTTNSNVIRLDLGALAIGEPVFLGVGNTPSTSISALGYANTTSSAPPYFNATDAPFGGTLNIFGNLQNFRQLGATHYRVNVNDGTTTTSLKLSWNTTHYNITTGIFEPFPVAPIAAGDDRYLISTDYSDGTTPDLSSRWWPPFLMMRWPSGVNGTYTFSVEILKLTGTTWTDLTGLLPAAKNKLVLKIDNDPPDVDLTAIYRHGVPAPLAVCDLLTTPAFPPATPLDFRIKAFDANGHLLSYSVTAYFGHLSPPVTVFADTFVPGHVVGGSPHLWTGPPSLRTNDPGGPLPSGWTPPCNCAYTFILDVWKRTIDGSNYIIRAESHQSITIMNAGAPGTTCP